MNISTKLLKAAAGQAGGAGLDVDDCFSCHLYNGADDVDQTITNNIDLTEGGLVWIKSRTETYDHALYDTERGVHKYLESNQTGAEVSNTTHLKAFNNNGFTVGVNLQINKLNEPYVSWTFRKAEKFFDVVTWTGDGTTGRSISHSLDSPVGMIIAKKTSGASQWSVLHRSVTISGSPAEGLGRLNLTNAFNGYSTGFNGEFPSSTAFKVSHVSGASSQTLNTSGETYVAYLFAHNDDDGEFGPDLEDIIKCDKYTGGTTGTEVNVGFEPQFLMIKRAVGGTGDWMMFDAMRGVVNSAYPDLDNTLFANLTNAERTNTGYIGFTPTGFIHQGGSGDTNTNGDTYVYMAIRRGSLVEPDDATKVFAVAARTGESGNQGAYRSGFPVDMAFHKVVTNSINPYEIGSRLTQGKSLNTTDTSVEATQGDQQYDYMDGWNSEASSSASKYSWMWKRARGFFDVVVYVGPSTTGNISHNLGVVPEMMWVKNAGNAENWAVYHKDLGNTYYLHLNTDDAASNTDGGNFWNSTTPTASVFSVGTSSLTSHYTRKHVAYLFATVPNVSFVGSYDGNGSNQNIDCGFSSGARFILIKSKQSGSWYLFDTVRGIVSGNDSHLKLNTSDAEAYADSIDTYSGGFNVVQNATTDLNKGPSDESYIFYAIA